MTGSGDRDTPAVEPAILEIQDGVGAYGSGRTGRTAVEGLSLSVGSGEIVAILGPNGAGKSTLIHLASGWLVPRSGRVLLEGQDLATLDRRSMARRVALVAQNEVPPGDITVTDLVGLGRGPHRPGGWWQDWVGLSPGGFGPEDRAAVEAAVGWTCLEGYEDRPVGSLSGGERQRVLLARALAQRPRILLLDEPSSSLDPAHQQAMTRLVRRLVAEGVLAAAVVVLHDLNLAATVADRLVLMNRGRIVAAGRPEEVLREEVLSPVYGVPLGIHHLPQGRPLVYLPD